MATYMRHCLVFAIFALWVGVVSANEEESKTTDLRKWFIGVGMSVNRLQGWGANRRLMQSNKDSWGKLDIPPMTSGNKLYIGYRLLDNVDVEIAYWRTGDWTHSYVLWNTLPPQYVSQRINVRGQYISGAFRPFPSRWGNGFFLKLGVQHSTLTSMTIVNGVPFSLGGSNPNNGSVSGYGVLWGFGYDVVAGQAGAVRIESIKFQNVGGSSFGNQSIGVGYYAKF